MAKRQWRRITPEHRREIIRLAAQGVSGREIARRVGRWETQIRAILRPLGGVIRPELWQVSAARLSLDDRVEIRLGLERGESCAAIGRSLGRHRSTICR